MKRTLLTILLSAFLGGLFGSYLTINYLDKLPWSPNQNLSALVSNREVKITEESAVIEVVKKASPSVVSVVIEKDVSQASFSPWDFFFGLPNTEPNNDGNQLQKIGGGSGFIISEDGLIMTNRHVINDQSAKYTVVLNDGKEYDAKIIGTDLFNDIGILKIEANNLPIVELGNSSDLQIGQGVVAIGNALAQFSNTVTSGVVSGIGRSILASSALGESEKLEDVIQTDAAINPGNSGGPLLDLDGRVVGINTAISQAGQLIGFAIPINTVKPIIDSVKQSGRIVRPYLGVRYVMLNEQIASSNNLSIKEGALILKGDGATQLAILPDSPAAKAGLAENDIILEINNTKISQDHTLAEEISQHQPGENIKLKVWRNGEEREVTVQLEEYKQS